jgi:CBS domain containing-hemolysin-like protein
MDWLLVCSTTVLVLLAIILSSRVAVIGAARLIIVAYVLTPIVTMCAVAAAVAFFLTRSAPGKTGSSHSDTSFELSGGDEASSNDEMAKES